VWHSQGQRNDIKPTLAESSQDITNWHNADVFEWHIPLVEVWPQIDFGDWYKDFDVWQ
jgi:hypothetical protein